MIDKNIKILTICRHGNCRSVGTRYCLYRRGYVNTIAIGCIVPPIETLKMLCDWADKILVAKSKHGDVLPGNAQGKIDKQFTIGEDKWGNPMNKELHSIVNKQLDLIGLT